MKNPSKKLRHKEQDSKPFGIKLKRPSGCFSLAGMSWLRILGLALVIGFAGCEKPVEAPTPIAPVAISEPTEALPPLPTIKIWLGAAELRAELATHWRQQQTGMMFRTNLAENAGMLFVFSQPHQAAFYMKNTTVPLSAAYVDPDGVILEIHDLHPLNTNSVYAASDRVQYVLETNQGWFKRNQVSVGTIIRTEQGSLQETFFRRRN